MPEKLLKLLYVWVKELPTPLRLGFLSSLIIVTILALLLYWGTLPSWKAQLGAFAIAALAILFFNVAAYWFHLKEAKEKEAKEKEAKEKEAKKKEAKEPLRDDRLSLGILSFAKDEQEKVAGEGFAFELQRRFSKLNDVLRVVPQDSIFAVDPTNVPVPEIAERLHADWLVDGKVQATEGNYKVQAKVIDAKRGASEDVYSWEAPQDNLFKLQTEVAEWVARTLPAVIRRSGYDEALKRQPAANVAAYLEYENGLYSMRQYNNSREESRFDAAERSFRKAIEYDDKYAEAYAELGFPYIIRAETGSDARWHTLCKKEFEKALELQPNHPIALAELGYLTFSPLKDDTEKALRSAQLAVEADRDSTERAGIDVHVCRLL